MTLHLVGSNNTRGRTPDMDAEADERMAANIAWLRKAFADAKRPAEIEVYAGAMHGWTVPGGEVYNQAQAEKAWERLLTLFKKAL
jgi:carboxymethylenebutenolidase